MRHQRPFHAVFPILGIVTLAAWCGVGPPATLAQDAEVALPPPARRTVDFSRDIRPILAMNCYSCHGPQKQKSDLRLDRKSAALRGGTEGPVIVPGKSAE